MKNILKVSFLILLVSQVCIAEWQNKKRITYLNQNAVCYAGAENIFILCDEGNLLFTYDSGISWDDLKLTESSKLNAIRFLDDQVSFIVGDEGRIFRSENHWHEWKDISIQDYFHLKDVAFNDYRHGVVVGSKEVRIDGRKYFLPSIHITINWGYSWVEIAFDFKGKLNSVVYFTDEIIWAVGDGGMIIKSADRGRNWTVEKINIKSNLNSIQICPDQSVIIAGDSGVLLYSDDLGQSWTQILIPEYYNIKSACCNEYGDIIAAGNKEVKIDGRRYYMATILRSTTSNKCWQEEFSEIEGSYNSISICNPKQAMAVGDDGVIAQFNISSIVSEVSKIPTFFKLKQNFPNPFNPITKISWESPVRSWQTLKVFDILGKEITTLVDEEKEAGYYLIDFNSSDLPTGVYFYQLKAGPSSSSGQVFVDTKKMILMK